jgi:hypothetical protein
VSIPVRMPESVFSHLSSGGSPSAAGRMENWAQAPGRPSRFRVYGVLDCRKDRACSAARGMAPRSAPPHAVARRERDGSTRSSVATVHRAPRDLALAERQLDPVRGAEVARQLRSLGVKGILVKAAELGYITELACGMLDCRCPEELGGRAYFKPGRDDWSPTHEHSPTPKREGGKRTVDNSVLAHRLCNRIDYSKTVGRSHQRDLDRIERARTST